MPKEKVAPVIYGTREGADTLAPRPGIARVRLGRVAHIPQHASDPELILHSLMEQAAQPDRCLCDLSSPGTVPDSVRYGHILREHALDAGFTGKADNPAYMGLVGRCLDMIAGLWRLPADAAGYGVPAFSGEYAAMTAAAAALKRWRIRQAGHEGGMAVPNIVATPGRNPAWDTIADILGMRIRVAQPPYETTLAEACDPDTVMTVATVASTATSLDDDIPAISAELERIGLRYGLSAPLHVDATAGGFVKPFLDPRDKWDFRVPGVASISASTEWAGVTQVALGWVLWRDTADTPFSALADEIGRMDEREENGERFHFTMPGMPVLTHFHDMMRLGYDGHRVILYERANITERLLSGLREIPGLIPVGNDPRTPFIVFRPDAPGDAGSLWKALSLRGWKSTRVFLPPEYGGMPAIRIIIPYAMSEELAELFLADLGDIVSKY